MNKDDIGIIIIVVGFTLVNIIGLTSSCTSSSTGEQPYETIIYVPTNDSVSINKIVYLKEQLRRTQDSLNAFKNSMSSDEFIAKYKLERIRHYTNIVDKNPKQIKYYKGWIKRVLE